MCSAMEKGERELLIKRATISSLMACWDCLVKRGRHEARKSVTTGTRTHEEESKVSENLSARVTPHYRFGALGTLEQILIQQHLDKEKHLWLLKYAEGIIKDTSVPLTKKWNERLLHEIVSYIPHGKNEEVASRGLIQAVLQGGVDTSVADSSGDSPLIKALKMGNRVAVDTLLHSKCDINVRDHSGRTSLICATQSLNNTAFIKMVLQQYCGVVKMDVYDNHGCTALAYAASNNSISICHLLLQAGANPNAGSMSPLRLAIENNCRYELIELLVESGSSVMAVDHRGEDILSYAARSGRLEVVTLLIRHEASFNKIWHRNQAFMSALQRDYVDIIRIFIDHGVSIHEGSGTVRGQNIVHNAAAWGSSAFLSYLVSETNINLDQQDRYGKTAFYLSAVNGNRPCMEVLFHAGIDCCVADYKDRTPLEAALFKNQCASVTFFLDYFACPCNTLFSILRIMQDIYDNIALSKISAVVKFDALLRKQCEEKSQVESLTNMCILTIRQSLGQRGWTKVKKLPLPSRVQDGVLKVKRF